MFFGEYNLLLLLFFVLFFCLLLNVNSFLHLLLIAELLWVTLYGFALLIGHLFTDLNALSLTFFFLIFSAIELGIGLELLSIQNLVTRSLSPLSSKISQKHSYRFTPKTYTTRNNWRI